MVGWLPLLAQTQAPILQKKRPDKESPGVAFARAGESNASEVEIGGTNLTRPTLGGRAAAFFDLYQFDADFSRAAACLVFAEAPSPCAPCAPNWSERWPTLSLWMTAWLPLLAQTQAAIKAVEAARRESLTP